MSKGQAPVDIKEVKDVNEPTAEERARHELTHNPAQPWCPCCTLGKGTEKIHVKSSEADRERPMMQLDFAFNATRSVDSLESAPSLEISLVAVYRQPGFLYGNALGSKEADGLSVKETNQVFQDDGLSTSGDQIR